MRNRFLTFLFTVAATGGLTGCTSQPKTAGKDAKEEPAEVVEAPLGSRIKKKSTINPMAGATREQIEQERTQQAARQAGAVNDPQKYSGRR